MRLFVKSCNLFLLYAALLNLWKVRLTYVVFDILFVYQKATKWSERKDAVAELTKLASTKRIAPGDFSEVCRTLKKVCYCFFACTFFPNFTGLL